MPSRTFVRWSGPAAVLGGALWIVGAVMTALKPEGCIGDACDLPGRSMRGSGALEAVLFLAAVLLIALGAVGVVLLARASGRLGPAGRAGLVLGLAGVGLLLAGGLAQALLFGGDFPAMPLFVLPGMLALVTGFLLLGVAVLRAGAVPRWAGGLLMVGALALLGFNDQNAQALLAVPFGLAWVAVGTALWSGRGEPPALA